MDAPNKEDIIVHGSMTKDTIYGILKERQAEDDSIVLPRANEKKEIMLNFAIEAFGADRVIKEPTELTAQWAAEDGSGRKSTGARGKPARDPMDWTREEIQAEADKYENRSVWNRKGKESHAAARAQGILEEVMPAKTTRVASAVELTEESVIAKMQEFDNRTDFSHAHRKMYHFARDNGLLDQYLPSKMGGKASEETASEETEIDEDEVEVED